MIAIMLVAAALALPERSLRSRVDLKTSSLPTRFVSVLSVIFVLVLLVLTVGTLALVLAGAMIAFTAAISIRSTLRKNQRRRDSQQLAIYVAQLSADLSAGADRAQALNRAAEQIDNARSPRLEVVALQAARQAHFGHNPANVFSEPTMPEQLHRLGRLWEVADRYGIALAGLLETVHRSLEGQKRHRRTTEASLQGPQATAVILTCLPVAGIALGTVMGARPVEFLFSTALGGVLLVVGVALACTGLLWARAMTTAAAGDC